MAAPVTRQRLEPVGLALPPDAVAPGLPVLRPLGLGEQLDRAMDLYARRFVPCFLLAFLAQVPSSLLNVMLRGSGAEESLGLELLSSGVLSPVLTTVFVATFIGREALGRPLAVSLGPATLLNLVLIVLMTALGALLVFCCVVPGLAWLWLFSVVPLVYLFEPPLPGVAHLPRSIRRGLVLVQGMPSFGRWLGLQGVRSLVVAPAGSLLLLFELPEARAELIRMLSLSGAGFQALELALSAFLISLGSAFGAVVLIVFYVDLRVRREGLDLELALARIGGERGDEALPA